MKIHILSKLQEGAWGGGNQFQKALREYFRDQGCYAEKLDTADVVLVNSHHWIEHLWNLFLWKRSDSRRVILHRVDGPISIVRGAPEQILIDQAIIAFNHHFADSTIFQSTWSKEQCLKLGMETDKPSVTILNAPDTSIFYPAGNSPPRAPLRIIATSWSDNWRKGFDVYQYLDEQLDYERFAFTFVGNSPIPFKKIRHIPPMDSHALANELRQHDIYLQASHLESCSNALIEGMHCGLVPLARNNTSHPQIVGESGILFNGREDVLDRLDDLVSQKDRLRKKFALPTINEVGDRYLHFAQDQRTKALGRNVTILGLMKVTTIVASMWIQPRIKKLLRIVQP